MKPIRESARLDWEGEHMKIQQTPQWKIDGNLAYVLNEYGHNEIMVSVNYAPRNQAAEEQLARNIVHAISSHDQLKADNEALLEAAKSMRRTIDILGVVNYSKPIGANSPVSNWDKAIAQAESHRSGKGE